MIDARPQPRLLAAITAHGYGHAAQALVAVDALMRQRPDIDLHIATGVPEPFVRSRLSHEFSYHSHTTDFGLKMTSALDIDREASASAYASQVRLWDSLVEAETRFLDVIRPDLLLADIPYIPLVAARRLNIPVVGLCSLNWAGIFRHYFPDHPEAERILEKLIDAYAGADVFLTPQPSMPMPELPNTRSIGPLALSGTSRRETLNVRLNLAPDERLVVVAMGGVELRLPMEEWPALPGIHWLVPDSWKVQRPDATSLESLGMRFVDILASSDALLGKPGYGTVTECAVNATPMLYVSRADWPEEPWLVAWMQEVGGALQVDRRRLESGRLDEPLTALLQQPRPCPPRATGAEEAVDVLLEYLGG